MTEIPDSITVLVRCNEPECSYDKPQSLTFSRKMLADSLKRGDEIRATGFYCGHSWILDAQERENTKKLLTDQSM